MVKPQVLCPACTKQVPKILLDNKLIDIKHGCTWKHKLFPPPVGINTKTSRPDMDALMISSWLGLNLLRGKS